MVIYFLIGVVVGVFIPSPIDTKIKSWCKALKDKIIGIFKKTE